MCKYKLEIKLIIPTFRPEAMVRMCVTLHNVWNLVGLYRATMVSGEESMGEVTQSNKLEF